MALQTPITEIRKEYHKYHSKFTTDKAYSIFIKTIAYEQKIHYSYRLISGDTCRFINQCQFLPNLARFTTNLWSGILCDRLSPFTFITLFMLDVTIGEIRRQTHFQFIMDLYFYCVLLFYCQF